MDHRYFLTWSIDGVQAGGTATFGRRLGLNDDRSVLHYIAVATDCIDRLEAGTLKVLSWQELPCS